MLQLILIPAVITLAVTLLRLIGELNEWSPLLFSTAAGGGSAVVGIAWLVPIFGIYFALKLGKTDREAPSGWRAAGFALLGIGVVVVFGVAGGALQLQMVGQLAVMGVASVLAAAIQLGGWPQLTKVLWAYGVAARIPVIVVMFFAIMGRWGTHYDAPPPDFPEMGPLAEFLALGVIPQLTIWIAYTVILGALFGGIARGIASLREPAASGSPAEPAAEG